MNSMRIFTLIGLFFYFKTITNFVHEYFQRPTLNNVLISEKQVTNIMKTLNITDFQLTNLDFYKTAFIHKSYCKLKDYEEYEYPGQPCLPLQETSYETMEFLGDAILGSVVSSYLYERFYKIQKVLIYPQKSKAKNQAFDVTPAKLVTGLITEKGICEASEKGLKGLFK